MNIPKEIFKATPTAFIGVFIVSLITVIPLVRWGGWCLSKSFYKTQLESFDKIADEDPNKMMAWNLPLSKGEGKTQLSVQRHCRFNDDTRVISYDFYATDDSSVFPQAPLNALVSCVVFGTETPTPAIGCFLVDKRTELETIESSLRERSSDTSEGLSTSIGATILTSSWFVSSPDNQPIFGDGVDTLNSYLKDQLPIRVFHDTANDNESKKLLRLTFEDPLELRGFLALDMPRELREQIGEIAGSSRRSLRLYTVRVFSGGIQLLSLALMLTCCFFFTYQYLVARRKVKKGLSVNDFLEYSDTQSKTELDAMRIVQSLPFRLSVLIPTIGLIGTIFGVSQAVFRLREMVSDDLGTQQTATSLITTSLGTAFDTTLVAAVAWIIAEAFRVMTLRQYPLLFSKTND